MVSPTPTSIVLPDFCKTSVNGPSVPVLSTTLGEKYSTWMHSSGRSAVAASNAAIIGAGPSAFYAAAALIKQEDVEVRVDLFDRLPAPYGLVRYGVAPDHQRIKSVAALYEKTASDPRVRFFGCVEFGKHITIDNLRPLYDMVVFDTPPLMAVSDVRNPTAASASPART